MKYKGPVKTGPFFVVLQAHREREDDEMKKTLIILACFFFAAGMIIGYFRDVNDAAHPPAGELAVSIIGGGIIYTIVGAGICLIFVLPVYVMWKKKHDEDGGE